MNIKFIYIVIFIFFHVSCSRNLNVKNEAYDPSLSMDNDKLINEVFNNIDSIPFDLLLSKKGVVNKIYNSRSVTYTQKLLFINQMGKAIKDGNAKAESILIDFLDLDFKELINSQKDEIEKDRADIYNFLNYTRSKKALLISLGISLTEINIVARNSCDVVEEFSDTGIRSFFNIVNTIDSLTITDYLKRKNADLNIYFKNLPNDIENNPTDDFQRNLWYRFYYPSLKKSIDEVKYSIRKYDDLEVRKKRVDIIGHN